MAILKYTNKDGQLITVNSYKINNVIVSQEKGQSTADVMSQKAVTDELNSKANKSDIPTKTSQLTNDSGYLTQHQSLSDYAKKSEVNTELSKKVDNTTYTNDKQTFATKTEVDNRIKTVVGTAPEALDTLGEIADKLNDDSDAIEAINNVLSGKANSKDVYTKSESDTKYQIKGDYIPYVESANHTGYYEPNINLVIDGGEY
jgi:hypothetical protein